MASFSTRKHIKLMFHALAKKRPSKLILEYGAVYLRGEDRETLSEDAERFLTTAAIMELGLEVFFGEYRHEKCVAWIT